PARRPVLVHLWPAAPARVPPRWRRWNPSGRPFATSRCRRQRAPPPWLLSPRLRRPDRMRPLALRLSAFGAYAGVQEFDFAALGAQRLFLIHGPTGSGKTTLLDALCYALFGQSSGEERDAAHLRSHHAEAAAETWVELEFALGAEHFRIRRS